MSRFGQGMIASGKYFAPVGGNDGFTRILIGMDGVEGGTTFTDIAAAGPHVWTPTAAITTRVKRSFGKAVGQFLPPDLSTFAQLLNTASPMPVSNGSFCIECLVDVTQYQFNAPAPFNNSVSLYSSGYGYQLSINGSFQLVAGATSVGGGNIAVANTVTSSSTIPKDGKFHHVAGVRNGGDFAVYIDGVLGGSLNVGGTIFTMPSGTTPTQLNRTAVVQSLSTFPLYASNFRLSLGTPRYTGNFTPPAGPFN